MPVETTRALFELRRTHGHAMERLDRFVSEHPYMIAPNIIALLRHHLEDNISIIDKAGEGGESS